jgi:hypothetical protein
MQLAHSKQPLQTALAVLHGLLILLIHRQSQVQILSVENEGGLRAAIG